jgi:hypothetical protein
MYRAPSLVLSAASLLQLASIFVYLIPHMNEYLKDNQLYEAFVLGWMERLLVGSQYVVYFGGVVIVAQVAMLIYMIRSKDDDSKPSAVQWAATALTMVEAGLAFRFSDKPECESANPRQGNPPLAVRPSTLLSLFFTCSRRFLCYAPRADGFVGRDLEAALFPRHRAGLRHNIDPATQGGELPCSPRSEASRIR